MKLPMADNTKIDPKALKLVLKVCRDFGVSEIEYQGIKVVFGEPASKPQAQARVFRAKGNEEMIKKIERESLEQASMELDQEAIAFGHIEDPLGFEEKLIRKELVDGEETAQH